MTEKYINPHNDPRIYWASEVTFGYGTGEQIRVDYMLFKPINNSVSGIEKGDFYVYEIKSSVDDFRSPNGHNMIGDYNYYVMPHEVYEEVKYEIPYWVGVLVPDSYKFERNQDGQAKWSYLRSEKRARRQNRTRPLAEMLLMMFRSCARDRKREE